MMSKRVDHIALSDVIFINAFFDIANIDASSYLAHIYEHPSGLSLLIEPYAPLCANMEPDKHAQHSEYNPHEIRDQDQDASPTAATDALAMHSLSPPLSVRLRQPVSPWRFYVSCGVTPPSCPLTGSACKETFITRCSCTKHNLPSRASHPTPMASRRAERRVPRWSCGYETAPRACRYCQIRPAAFPISASIIKAPSRWWGQRAAATLAPEQRVAGPASAPAVGAC
jgi:hypothetical protein